MLLSPYSYIFFVLTTRKWRFEIHQFHDVCYLWEDGVDELLLKQNEFAAKWL